MKHVLRILPFALFIPLFFSCRNEAENTDQVLTDTLTTVDTIPEVLPGYSSKFKALMLTDTALFRGKKLGQTQASLTEPSLEKIEENASSITYNVTLEATEYGDIMYSFNNAALSSIEVFIYPKNDSSLKALKAEMVEFYSKKLGADAVKKGGKTTILNPSENIGVEWTEEGNKKIKDLRMYIFTLSAL